MPEQSKQEPRKFQIKISDEILKGAYANAMQVSHTQEEFVLDFMNLTVHQGVGIASSRIIMSPGHLKRVILALQENVKRYEERFGQIKIADAPNQEIGFKE